MQTVEWKSFTWQSAAMINTRTLLLCSIWYLTIIWKLLYRYNKKNHYMSLLSSWWENKWRNIRMQLSIYHDKNTNLNTPQALEMIQALGMGRNTRVRNKRRFIQAACLSPVDPLDTVKGEQTWLCNSVLSIIYTWTEDKVNEIFFYSFSQLNLHNFDMLGSVDYL